MNWKLEKLGAEPKKIAVLAVLLASAGYFFFSNSGSSGASDSPAPSRQAAAPEPLHPLATSAGKAPTRNLTRSANASPKEFRPSFRTKDIDPSKVDPDLHLSLLARLKNVSADAGTRSLFDIAPEPVEKIEVKEPGKIAVAKPFVGPMPQSAESKSKAGDPDKPAADPKAPPIPLKFYGFVNPPKAGIKRAFFLDGEDIVIAGEGDTIKKRYKIIRIGVNSAVVEDTEFKGDNQQTLPLVAEVAG